MALEDSRVALFFKLLRFAEMERPGYVRGSVLVLTAGVQQINLVAANNGALGLIGSVMDDSRVWPRRRNCLERKTHKIGLLASRMRPGISKIKLTYFVGAKLPSEILELQGCIVLGQIPPLFLQQLLLQP